MPGIKQTLLNPVHEDLANAEMAEDFLCPSGKRRWARLHLAIAHWHRLDPKANNQSTLSEAIKIRPPQLSYARSPHPEDDTDGNKLSPEKHRAAAKILGVDPDWLAQGYSEHGSEVWPDWTAEATKPGRATLAEIFIAYLAQAQIDQPVPQIVAGLLQRYRDVLAADITRLRESLRPYPITVVDSAELLASPWPRIGPGDPWQVVRTYLTRAGLSVNAFLGRYREALQSMFASLVAGPVSTLPPSQVLFGLTAEQVDLEIRVRSWLRELAARLPHR